MGFQLVLELLLLESDTFVKAKSFSLTVRWVYNKHCLLHDVVSGSDIMPCIKIDKPLVASLAFYHFSPARLINGPRGDKTCLQGF